MEPAIIKLVALKTRYKKLLPVRQFLLDLLSNVLSKTNYTENIPKFAGNFTTVAKTELFL